MRLSKTKPTGDGEAWAMLWAMTKPEDEESILSKTREYAARFAEWGIGRCQMAAILDILAPRFAGQHTTTSKSGFQAWLAGQATASRPDPVFPQPMTAGGGGQADVGHPGAFLNLDFSAGAA